MSKSAGNVMDPNNLIDLYGVEAVRYYFMREVHFGNDGSFSHEAIVNRVNADLANDLGNLAQRSLSMIAKNCDGLLPQRPDLQEMDVALINKADALLEECDSHMSRLAIHDYVGAVIQLVSDTNRYFAEQEPWALKKTDPDRMASVLYVTAEIIRQAAIAMQPVTPNAANQILDLLLIPGSQRDFKFLGSSGRLATASQLPKPEGVFPRVSLPEATED